MIEPFMRGEKKNKLENEAVISIICPVRNVEPYIAVTIESVLNQAYDSWELLVMDGTSTDRTCEIVRSYAAKDSRIRLYSEPDESPWHAVDKGFNVAQGAYITIVCGQDGFLDPDWLARAARALEEDRDIALVWALSKPMDESGHILPETERSHYISYAHFLGQEAGTQTAPDLAGKASRIIRDLFFGSWKRKKFLLEKLFSRSAILRINLFMRRGFKNEKIPQKKDWFPYWLTTGLTFPDQSMVVSKRVFLDCVPRYEIGSKTLGYLNDFYYNFNVKGYLPHFIPTYATFGRQHKGASGERGADEMHHNLMDYLTKVAKLRKQFKSRKDAFVFRRRDGSIIET